MKKAIDFFKKDPVLAISGILAFFSLILVFPDKEYIDYLDFRVLALLFALMCVMKGYQEIGLFNQLAVMILKRTKNTRQLAAVLVLLCFFFSMLITNDVALITFVPFTILVLDLVGQKKLMIYIIVLQTIAANLGSMLTPIGNPQNLYLYNLSGMSFADFTLTLLPYSLLSLLLLIFSFYMKKKEHVSLENIASEKTDMDKRAVIIYTLLFLICLGCVLHLVSWQAVLAITLIVLLLYNRKLLLQADYGLLLTFVFFFIFIGNMGRIPSVSDLLSYVLAGRELLISVLASQVISNVPAAILLSGFTSDYTPLLIGVNLGGLGTLIASLASLISYKQYAAVEGCDKGRYMIYFTAMNLLFLAVLLIAAYLF